MTKPVEFEELERKLEAAAPEPPEELLTALKKEIPDDLGGAVRPARRGWGVRRWQLAAATVFLAVVGLVIGDQVRRQVPLGPAAGEDTAGAIAPAANEVRGRQERALAGAVSGSAESAGLEGGVAPESGERREQDAVPPAPLAADKRRPAGADAEASSEAVGLSTDERWRRIEQKRKRLEEELQDEPGAPPARPDPVELEAKPLAKSRKTAILDPTSAADVGARAAEPAPPPASPPVIVLRSEAPRLVETKLRDAGAAPSTGGTAEPNDQPYGDMFFRSAGVNPFIDSEDDRLSTFGLDVDTGSYTVTRSYLDRGHLPPAAAVRVEEFVNSFSYGDEPPRRGDFALSAEGAPSPFAEGPRYQVLRIGVRAREIDRAERRSANLVFVVDVSGSMAREDRLGLVRRALELLLDQLSPDDRVGLVVYGNRGEVVLEPTADHEAIRRAIDRLQPAGATNAEEGLVLGYRLARRFFREGAINRIVLCSDGVANVGRTGPESILARVAAAAEEGIELTTVGFGMGNYNDVLMEQLADRGDGRYAYVDTLAEARKLFVENLTGTLQTIASDAKIQVEFDPEVVSRYRLLGYENRDIADERFRDDAVDAGEIGAGHAVSAVYEVKLASGLRGRERVARISLRWRSAESGQVEEISRDLAVKDLARSWNAASRGLRLASIVAEFGEILRRSYWARASDLGDLLRRAQELSPAFAGDADVAELVSLIGKAERLSAAAGGSD